MLSRETLALRDSLPLRMSPVSLSLRDVRLAPLSVESHGASLYAVSNGNPVHSDIGSISDYDADALIWRYMNSGPFESRTAFDAYLQPLVESGNGIALCVLDAKHNQPVGVATFMNNSPEHLKVELGNIWYSPIVQGKGYNLVATYLMAKHAFDLGYRRVEWKCNALNERSRRAALRMGFKFEGVQESHFIIKNKNRDTAWFRMLDREWPEVKLHLEAMIASN